MQLLFLHFPPHVFCDGLFEGVLVRVHEGSAVALLVAVQGADALEEPIFFPN